MVKDLDVMCATFEQSMALKQLGFDEICFFWYDSNRARNQDFVRNSADWLGIKSCACPLRQEVFRWFRDKHNLRISFPYWNGFNGQLSENMRYKYECLIIPENAKTITVRSETDSIYFSVYEEAENYALNKLINILQERLNS
jgi:hypothetical protein